MCTETPENLDSIGRAVSNYSWKEFIFGWINGGREGWMEGRTDGRNEGQTKGQSKKGWEGGMN